MDKETLTEEILPEYVRHLQATEKSPATIEKYSRCAGQFIAFLSGAPLKRESVLAYKAHISVGRSASGINSALAALNSFLVFLGRGELKVRLLKIQSKMFTEAERELSKKELLELSKVAQTKGRGRIHFVLQTLAVTGMRVSELEYVTVEALERGRAEINMKGKVRVVLLPTQLCRRLRDYARSECIRQGPVFVTRNGLPLDRSNIWKALKRLSGQADIPLAKVYPHNLRHLFARSYYEQCPDLVELAGILGHSNINTTRIYTATLGSECRMRLDSMQLLP